MNLKTLVFISLLNCLFFTAGAQGKNYGILTMKKEDIKKYYDSNVAIFVFKYRKPLFASYKLKGTPFDADGRPVLQSFKLTKTNRHDKTRLQNFYKGILMLEVKEMKDNGVDGTFDIYLVPVPYSKAADINYVSYLVNNTPDKIEKTGASSGYVPTHPASGPLALPPLLPFTSFTLNPSPPYRSGTGH